MRVALSFEALLSLKVAGNARLPCAQVKAGKATGAEQQASPSQNALENHAILGLHATAGRRPEGLLPGSGKYPLLPDVPLEVGDGAEDWA